MSRPDPMARGHVGEPGERQVFARLELQRIHEFRGVLDTKVYLHVWHNGAGNVLVWRTGKPLLLELGEMMDVRATVKEHSFYRGTAQTVLTRCKIETLHPRKPLSDTPADAAPKDDGQEPPPS